jgi:hypothetical protein
MTDTWYKFQALPRMEYKELDGVLYVDGSVFKSTFQPIKRLIIWTSQ